MRWFSIIAIFFLFWFLALFVVLPFSARTAEEAGEKPLPGHVESAPHQFRPWLVVWRTTVIAVILTAPSMRSTGPAISTSTSRATR